MSRRCPVCGTEYPDEVAFCGHDGSVNVQITAEPDARLGQRLGDYTVAAHVADGAMGAVYEARHAVTHERVAIKILHPDIEEDEIAVERFKREYETADMFTHPHIVKVIDFGETAEGSHFLTMEYLVGLELGQLMRSRGKVGPARMLRLLAQVADALEYAHSFGVIHRDLKPDNIYLCSSDQGDDVRILDFGSVKLQVETGPKLTAFGTTLGSPFYMSPEQAKGLHDVDSRTDVFAIAAILYEALSGKVAFDAPTVAEILMKIVRHMPPKLSTISPEVPPALDEVIEKGIAKDKKLRYESCTALVDAAFAGYGVSGGAKPWADRPLAELEAEMARTASSTRPPPPQAAPLPAGLPPPPAMSLAPKPQSSRTLLIAGLVIGGLVLLGTTAVCLLFVGH